MTSQDATTANLLKFCRIYFRELVYSILNTRQFPNNSTSKKVFDVNKLHICYVCLSGSCFDTSLSPECVPKLAVGDLNWNMHRYSKCFLFTHLKDAVSHCGKAHKNLLKFKSKKKAENY